VAELKTKKNDASVTDFLNSIENPTRRQDGFTILSMMKEITGLEPAMWGDSMVGFGSLDYTYASGHSGTWFKVGFSPRKQNLTLYISTGIDRYAELLQRLGKHKTGVGCLYINKLADVDLDVLREMITKSART
jgi:hypothetical protein